MAEVNTRSDSKVVALEARLRNCHNVITLGVRPNYGDYTTAELALMQASRKIYYPSSHYAGLFDAAGIRIFPGLHNYRCSQDKIRQTTLFQVLGIPHPRTRFFFGRHQQARIPELFAFPFIAKVPRGSAMGRGVYLIRDSHSLESYCSANHLAYIQEYLPIDRDVRVVVIGGQVVAAYWRLCPDDDFRSNLSIGGRVSLDPVPETALQLARHTAARCRWDDVGIDLCCAKGQWYVLEGNMKYGRQGMQANGIDFVHLMERLIDEHKI
jgi:ribosomal protein S6--L-glutamate ligase